MRTLAHLSDIHFGRLDAPVAESLVPYLQGLRPDLMVVSGDFTQRARAAQFRDARSYLRRFSVPQFWTPGNHDVPLWAFWERFTSPLGRYRANLTDNLAASYQDAEVSLACLCSARPFVWKIGGFWKDGALHPRQVESLRQLTGGVRILVIHHPLIGAPGKGNDGVLVGAEAALRQLAAVEVDIVLAGHLHEPYSAAVRVGNRSILSVQAGTATSYRRRNDAQGREIPNSFNLLRISPDRVEVEVHSYVEQRWARASQAIYSRKNEGGLHGFTL